MSLAYRASALLVASPCSGVCQATCFPMPSSGSFSGGELSIQSSGSLDPRGYTIMFLAIDTALPCLRKSMGAGT